MAKIIYKEGQEGQNRLECIEGIEIGLLNGQKALIYPKYAERQLLESEQISEWNARDETEIEALKSEDSAYKTGHLLAFDSPAAMWVTQFNSDKHDTPFYLPSLLAAMELQHQKEEIDAFAETIEGADLLQDFTSITWSCSNAYEGSVWVANGYEVFSSYRYLFGSNLSVPVILYR